jgi:hypothetical protein
MPIKHRAKAKSQCKFQSICSRHSSFLASKLSLPSSPGGVTFKMENPGQAKFCSVPRASLAQLTIALPSPMLARYQSLLMAPY